MAQRTVVAAAIANNVGPAADGKIFSVPRPGRHHNVIRLMAELGYPIPIIGTQGFLLSDGEFCTRKYAKRIAREAGQLLDRASPSADLFSEDVW